MFISVLPNDREFTTSMMYSDGRWPVQNGNAPVYYREATGHGQREQFQGVVVPINGSPARSNAAYQTNKHLPSTHISNGVSQIGPRDFPSLQTSHLRTNPSNGAQNYQINGGFSQPTADRQTSSVPPLDYQLLLLSLAEDYLAAAHSEGSTVALFRQEVDMQRYYKLIATGLGCLEAVLKVSKRQSTIYWSCLFIIFSIGG